MRSIVNISLPQQLNKLIEKEVSKGNFSTKSEFIRSLLRAWQEEKLAKELEASRNEIKEGKGELLQSLKDLR
jgi:putative addiction module CopG family antidote